MTDLSGKQYELADKIEATLEAADAAGLTPSTVARKAKIETWEARHILDWMVANRFAHASRNGNWKHYHAGRGRV